MCFESEEERMGETTLSNIMNFDCSNHFKYLLSHFSIDYLISFSFIQTTQMLYNLLHGTKGQTAVNLELAVSLFPVFWTLQSLF